MKDAIGLVRLPIAAGTTLLHQIRSDGSFWECHLVAN